MDELRQNVLYLLATGQSDLDKIQEELGLSEDHMEDIIKWLVEEGYLVSYTIH